MQSVLIQNTEKFSQRTFVPKGNPKLMAIFIDDLNMQKLDSCLTQNAIELVRQFMDYKHIYECQKMELMEFMNIQFIASMNPTAGSFNINPRLQRHFWICAIPFPSDDSIRTIYQFFLTGHFKQFPPNIQDLTKGLVAGIVKLHKSVFAKFKKSAINFHYEFNIRHITGVFQGVLMSTVEKFKDPEKVAKLWIHECERVYGDRLVSVKDLNTFRGELAGEVIKVAFAGKFNLGKYLTEKAEPIIFCRFVNGYLDNVYEMANKLSDVKDKANQALSEYNDSNTRMDLVLFDDAVKHVCRITRIISQPSGHANLVGVGGSGKQSLSKLSSFICQYNVYSITISSDYKFNSFKEDLQKMFNITGMSDDAGLLFILTENQIIDEKFMILVNDLLSSGDIQDLFNADDKEVIFNKVKAACKAATRKDTPQDVWNFFIGRVKKNLHVAICSSPGENL
jgi:dynein heavy chain